MKRYFLAALAIILILGCFSATTFADGADLITNGGFGALADDGILPQGWQLEAWYDTDSDRFAMLKTDVVRGQVAYIINYDENDTRLCQTIDVEPDSLYEIECYIKTRDVECGAGANISVKDTLAASDAVMGNVEWTKVELVGKTGASQTTMTVCARIGGYGALAYGEAWFDELTVKKIDSYTGTIHDFQAVDYSSYQNTDADTKSENGVVPYFGIMIIMTIITAVVCVVLYRTHIEKNGIVPPLDKTKKTVALIITLGIAFIIRIIIAMFIFGHPTDIKCFMAWSQMLANDGIQSFYTSGAFADYPPGYMYVLYFTGSIAKLLNITYGSTAYALLTKMPGILADIFAAYIVYRLAIKNVSQRTSLLLCAMVAFNPVMAFLSGGWGQIDQILTLLMVAVIYLFINKKGILAGLIYGIAIIVKPQALLFGPILAAAYFVWIKDDKKKAIIETLGGVAVAVGIILLLALPFKSTQEWSYIIEKILGTATSYPYASIEAFNLFALLGGNWKNVDSVLLGLSYGTYGTIFIALSVAASIIGYIHGRKSNKGALFLSSAFLIAAVFTLGQYMHERYLFPVLILLIIAFTYYKDKRLFVSYSLFSVSMLINAMAAFIITDHQNARGTQYDVLLTIGSLITIAGFVQLAMVSYDILMKHRTRPAFYENAQTRHEAQTLAPSLYDKKKLFEKKDKLLCFGLTAVYAVIALVNLGSLTAPENPWYAVMGDTAYIEFDEEVTIGEIRFFGGIYEGSTDISLGGSNIEYKQENGEMFRWKSITTEATTTKRVDMNVVNGSIWINEIAFFGEDGKQLIPTYSNAAELIDEQDEVPEAPSYMNGMYFDELYHARTAYEHLNGLSPYENSHPPLGKVFIMLGIAIFGMNAFGWRIIGTLFGIAMVPVMYMFAKRLFKKTDLAFLAAALFTFDFMHFAQTRIATIDVYAVFFILLMYYFMYRYYTMNFFTDGFKNTLKPLALAGIFFALGAASKWICIYAGGGLAVILFTSLARRYGEYRRLKNSDDEFVRKQVKPFYGYLIKTLLICCVFYIVVPIIVYLLSYIPYMLSEDKYDIAGIWSVQEFMYSYHSMLKATHAYESSWWQWPLDLRPIWFYVGYDVAEGNIRTISSFGNPVVWWPCAVGIAALIISRLRNKVKHNPEAFIILVGAAANFLPWVLVERCTFIYHYFATVPFIILATVYMLGRLEEKHPKLKNLKWVWLGICIALFIAFYPVLSGVEVSRAYVEFLEWLPGWTFRGI